MSVRKTIDGLSVIVRQPLRITEQDPLFLARFEWKDAHLKCAAIDPFQQRRVAPRVPNLLEYVAPVVAFDHASFHQLAVDVHGQPRQRCIGGEREAECPFKLLPGVVEVSLIDCRAGEAVFDIYVDVEFSQRQFHRLPLRVDDGDGPACVFAGRYAHLVCNGHQILDPFDDVCRSHGGSKFRRLRIVDIGNKLVSCRDHVADSADLHLALRDDDAGC